MAAYTYSIIGSSLCSHFLVDRRQHAGVAEARRIARPASAGCPRKRLTAAITRLMVVGLVVGEEQVDRGHAAVLAHHPRMRAISVASAA
jgi:hypothetical protein